MNLGTLECVELAASIAAGCTHQGSDVDVVLLAELLLPELRMLEYSLPNEKPVPCAWTESARRYRGCGATFCALVANGADLVRLVDYVRAERAAPAAAAEQAANEALGHASRILRQTRRQRPWGPGRIRSS